MLPKPYRLPGYRIIDVLKSSQFFYSPHLTIKILKKHQPQTQIGFIVSIKTCRLAVDRNKIKRQLRQAVKACLPQLWTNREIIILAKPSLKNLTFTQIEANLQRLLRQAKLLHETPRS